MKNKSEENFQVLNENIQIVPIKEEKKKNRIIIAQTTKEKEAKGTVISVGSDVEADIKVGDIVVYNPHLIGHEMRVGEEETIIINYKAIYGKFN